MLTIKEIRRLSGLSQAEFSKKYNIPQRNIERWESTGKSHSECPNYVKELLERAVREDFT